MDFSHIGQKNLFASSKNLLLGKPWENTEFGTPSMVNLTFSRLGSGADPGGIECSSRYGQIFPIMDTKIVLGKNSILIYFTQFISVYKNSENLSLLR